MTERYKADDNLNNCENGAEPDRISKDLVNDERKEVSKVPTAENENNLEGENVSDKNTKCEGGVTGENSDVSGKSGFTLVCIANHKKHPQS